MKISIEDYKRLSNPLTIDVRSKDKYNKNHIQNAINIPMEDILLNPELHLEKQKIYYIYCQKGIVSNVVCKELSKQGYNVIEIIGGYDSWTINSN